MTTEIIPAESSSPITTSTTGTPSAAPTLYQKIGAIMAEIGRMEKTGEGKGLPYKFIEYAVLAAKVRELFKAHGIVMLCAINDCVQTTQPTANGTTLHTIVHAAFTLVDTATGETLSQSWYGEANDNGDKGVNKAGTAATKYFLMKLFLVSDKDDPDAENNHATNTDTPTPAQAGEADSLSEKQLSAIYAIGYAAGLNKESIAAKSMEAFGYVPEQLTRGEASTFIEQLKTLPQKAKGAPKPTAAARS